MSSLLYGNSILISRPRYDAELGAWRPYASLSWDGDKFRYHRLKDLDRSFETEDEALAYGYSAAREWIDKQKLD